MTWSEVAQLVTAAVVVATYVRGEIRGRKSNRKLDDIHHLTNGMKTQLVEEVRNASFAKGVKSEADKKD